MKYLLQEKQIQWHGKPGKLLISANLTAKDTFLRSAQTKGWDTSTCLSVRELFEKTGQTQITVRDKFVGEEHTISIEPFLTTEPESVLTVEFDFKFDGTLRQLGVSSENVNKLLNHERSIRGSSQK